MNKLLEKQRQEKELMVKQHQEMMQMEMERMQK